MKIRETGLSFLFIFLLLLNQNIQSCTDFKLQAQDGTILITRSMEFGENLQSNIRTSPRGRHFNGFLAKDKSGINWNASYGYVYIDGFHVDAPFDGINEAGLSFEYLYLPSETKYQKPPQGKESQLLSYLRFGDWVLSQFKSIDEVRKGLNNIYVVSEEIPQLGSAVLPAHAAIYDANGNGIVVEFYDNKINIYDNMGVMTNSPKYDWHVTNLRNYINLSAMNANAITKMVYPILQQDRAQGL